MDERRIHHRLDQVRPGGLACDELKNRSPANSPIPQRSDLRVPLPGVSCSPITRFIGLGPSFPPVHTGSAFSPSCLRRLVAEVAIPAVRAGRGVGDIGGRFRDRYPHRGARTALVPGLNQVIGALRTYSWARKARYSHLCHLCCLPGLVG